MSCLKIDYLEHVQAFVTIDTDERGLLEIALQSPTGLLLASLIYTSYRIDAYKAPLLIKPPVQQNLNKPPLFWTKSPLFETF